MEINYQEIIRYFNIEGEIDGVEPFGNGLINKTFRLYNKEKADAPDYLMQRINSDVFADVPGMTSNLELVTTHLRKKKNTDYFLTPIATLSGDLVHRTNENHYWRMFLFLKDLRSYDKAPNNQYVYEGAKAFGQFVRDMSDFPAEKLHTILPEFHHLGKRFEQLRLAKNSANSARMTKCVSLFKKAELQYDRLGEMVTSIEQKIFPVRVTHNDTKFNNVLFKENGESGCVIDLDTTMSGIIHYDFGDGLRTGAVDCDEDEKDLEKITIQNDNLQTYCQGYLAPLQDVLSPVEIKFLPLAAPYMALIMSVRFLTDYLNNDTYYHIKYPEQNFMRAACQMRLSELFYEKREVVENLTGQ